MLYLICFTFLIKISFCGRMAREKLNSVVSSQHSHCQCPRGSLVSEQVCETLKMRTKVIPRKAKAATGIRLKTTFKMNKFFEKNSTGVEDLKSAAV